MADINKTVSINYVASTQKLEQSLKKIPQITEANGRKAANDLDKNFRKMERSADRTAKKVKNDMGKMKKAFAGVTATLGAVGVSTFMAAQKIADLTNELVDASAKTGIAVETLAGLRMAAEGSGQEFSALEGGLIKFQGSMDAAANGSKAMAQTFNDLGVEVRNSDGSLRDADAVFNEVITSMGNMEAGTQRNVTAMKLFGRTAGPGIIQSGAIDNLEQMTQFSKEFGVSLEEDAIAGMADFQRAVSEFSQIAFGVFNNLIDAIAGPGGSTAMVKGLSSAFIFVGNVAGDIMAAIGQAFENFFGFIQAGVLVMTGDFGLAVELIKTLSAESLDVGVNLANTFKNASAEVDKFNQFSFNSPAPGKFSATGKAAAETAKEVKKGGAAVKDLTEKTEDLAASFEGIAGGINEDIVTPLDKATERFTKTKEELDELAEKIKTQLSETPITDDPTAEAYQKRIELLELQKEVEQSIADNNDRFARDKKKINAEIFENDVKIMQERQALEQQIHDEAMARLEEQRAKQMEIANVAMSTFGTILQSMSDRYEATVEATERVRDDQIAAVEEMEKRGVISAEDAANKKERIEERYQGGIQEYKLKAFKADQAGAIADVIFANTVAIAKAFKDFGWPAGLAVSALVAAQGAAQIASIKAQSPPKFDVGGMIGNLDPTAPDQVQAQLLEGEAVLDRATVRRLGGPQGVKDLQTGGGGGREIVVIQPFKHFDRFIRGTKINRPKQSGIMGY